MPQLAEIWPGEIHGFVGNMGSGKSRALINEAKRQFRQDAGVLFIQPREAVRRSPDEAWSRSEVMYKPAHAVDQPGEILSLAEANDAKYIFIDEIQFFGKTPIMQEVFRSVINTLIYQGRTIFWSGLEIDFKIDSFEHVGWIMTQSDSLRTFEVECRVCGRSPASIPQRLRNGQPVPRSDPRFISDTDQHKAEGDTYEPRCRHCHQIAPEPDTNTPAD